MKGRKLAMLLMVPGMAVAQQQQPAWHIVDRGPPVRLEAAGTPPGFVFEALVDAPVAVDQEPAQWLVDQLAVPIGVYGTAQECQPAKPPEGVAVSMVCAVDGGGYPLLVNINAILQPDKSSLQRLSFVNTPDSQLIQLHGEHMRELIQASRTGRLLLPESP